MPTRTAAMRIRPLRSWIWSAVQAAHAGRRSEPRPQRAMFLPHGPGAFVLCDRMCLVSVSRVAIEGEDALVVAAVIAAGVGDAGEPGAAESAGDQVADGRVGIGLVPGADTLEIFAGCLVPHVMLTVFDSPVLACAGGEVPWAARSAGRLVMP